MDFEDLSNGSSHAGSARSDRCDERLTKMSKAYTL
jgi:hypothetical protein